MRNGSFVQFGYRFLDTLHCRDNIGACFPLGVKRQRGVSIHTNFSIGLLVGETDLGNIIDRDTCQPATHLIANGPQHNIANIFERIEFTFSAHDVAALAFINIACTHHRIVAPEHTEHI